MLRSTTRTALTCLVLAASSAGCSNVPIRNTFEDDKKQISQQIWKIDRVPGRAFIQSRDAVHDFNRTRRNDCAKDPVQCHPEIQEAPQGRQAAVVRAFPWDTETDEDGRNIVKHELWLKDSLRTDAEVMTWYAFWIHVDLTHEGAEDTRFVVAQWKEGAGKARHGNPYVALRYIGRKLAITVEDNRETDDHPWHVTIAAAEGAPSPNNGSIPARTREVKVFEDEAGLVEAKAVPLLKNADRWVEITIGIRRGRQDDGRKRQGEVVVYQDGRFVALARGDIGNEGALASNGYFKFGVYRDYDASECFRSRARDRCATIDVRLDDFRRAATREALTASGKQ